MFGVVRDVVLPADVRTRYDVYFSDRRVAIVCMGRAEREWDTQSLFPSCLQRSGSPPPTAPHPEKTQAKQSIDEKPQACHWMTF